MVLGGRDYFSWGAPVCAGCWNAQRRQGQGKIPTFSPRKAEMICDEESRLGNLSLFRIISNILYNINQYSIFNMYIYIYIYNMLSAVFFLPKSKRIFMGFSRFSEGL